MIVLLVFKTRRYLNEVATYVDLVSGASVNVSNGSLHATVCESNLGVYVFDNGASTRTLSRIR